MRASARPLHLMVRDPLDEGPYAVGVRHGLDLGLAEVGRTAELLRTPLVVVRGDADAIDAVAQLPETATCVQVVGALGDENQGGADGETRGPSIYTCPLAAWRADAWSVAAAPPSSPEHGERRGSRGERLVEWHPGLRGHGARQLNERFERAAGVPMDDAGWRGWMAVKVGFECGLRAAAGEGDLLALSFDGHKGRPLRFADDGHLVQPMYVVPTSLLDANSPTMSSQHLA